MRVAVAWLCGSWVLAHLRRPLMLVDLLGRDIEVGVAR